MLTDKELRSELVDALDAVTPAAPWLAGSIENAWSETQRKRGGRRITLGFGISLRLAAVAVLIALVLSITAVFLAIHQATNAVPAGHGYSLATARADWGMVSAKVGWQQTTWIDSDGWHHILRTTDSGAHWNDVSPFASVTKGTSPAVTPLLSGQPYILDANHAWLLAPSSVSPVPVQGSGAPQGVVTIRTADGGQTWQRGNVLGIDFAGGFFSLDFVDASHGWLFLQATVAPASVTWLFSTVDGGLNWKMVSSQSNGTYSDCSWDWIAFASPATGWSSVECPRGDHARNQIVVTHDGGSTWSIQPLPVTASETPSEPPIVFDKDHALFLVDYGQLGRRLLMTSDAGATWSARALPGEVQPIVDFIDSKHGWTVAGPGSEFLKTTNGLPDVTGVVLPLYHTDDGGLTWSRVLTTEPLESSQGRVGDVYFVDQRNGFMERFSEAAGRTTLFKTTDGGDTWVLIGRMPPQ